MITWLHMIHKIKHGTNVMRMSNLLRQMVELSDSMPSHQHVSDLGAKLNSGTSHKSCQGITGMKTSD